MKRTVYKFIGFTFLTMFLLAGNIAAQTPTPETAAKSFYKWYLGSLSREVYPRVHAKPQLLKRVSKRLGRWVYSKAYEDYGADYFIDAQDFDDKWENNISTSKATVKGNAATVKVTLTSPPDSEGRTGSHVLNVKLVKEAGAWKIDRVNGVFNE